MRLFAALAWLGAFGQVTDMLIYWSNLESRDIHLQLTLSLCLVGYMAWRWKDKSR